jgi:hypothetical protein
MRGRGICVARGPKLSCDPPLHELCNCAKETTSFTCHECYLEPTGRCAAHSFCCQHCHVCVGCGHGKFCVLETCGWRRCVSSHMVSRWLQGVCCHNWHHIQVRVWCAYSLPLHNMQNEHYSTLYVTGCGTLATGCRSGGLLFLDMSKLLAGVHVALCCCLLPQRSP